MRTIEDLESEVMNLRDARRRLDDRCAELSREIEHLKEELAHAHFVIEASRALVDALRAKTK